MKEATNKEVLKDMIRRLHDGENFEVAQDITDFQRIEGEKRLL